MGYQNHTAEEIYNLLITAFTSKFNLAVRLLKKSFLVVLAKVLSGVFVTLEKMGAWLFLQMFVDTCDFEETRVLGNVFRPLVKWGVQFGVGEPKNGGQWKGVITIHVRQTGSILTSGAQLKSAVTGLLYLTTESVSLDEAEVSAQVMCTEGGLEGNIDAEEILSFVNPLAAVEPDAEVSLVTAYGYDGEGETEYRKRVSGRIKNPPLGGALSDFRTWANGVAGVLNSYVYKETTTATGVLIYVAGTLDMFPDRIPSADLLVQVGKACTYDPETGIKSRKPVTAVIDPLGNESYSNVRPVTVTRFDVTIEGVPADDAIEFGIDVKAALEDYFLQREPYIRGLSDDSSRTDLITRNNLVGAADQTAVSLKTKFSDLRMFKEVGGAAMEFEEYTLGAGELAALGILTVNGEEVE